MLCIYVLFLAYLSFIMFSLCFHYVFIMFSLCFHYVFIMFSLCFHYAIVHSLSALSSTTITFLVANVLDIRLLAIHYVSTNTKIVG